jgi:hypothetical protein
MSCNELKTESALSLAEEKHPADEIGKALLQAGGILTSLSNCYDKPGASFAIGTPFIAEAIIAVEGILAKANDCLAKLYEGYDLGKLIGESTPLPQKTKAQAEPVDQESPETKEPVVENLSEQEEDSGYLGYFGRQDQVSRLSVKLDSILEKLPAQQQPMRAVDMIEQPAQNYEELLEKLTAMADAAAYQVHHNADADSNLLPVLESLRADVMRMRSVA